MKERIENLVAKAHRSLKAAKKLLAGGAVRPSENVNKRVQNRSTRKSVHNRKLLFLWDANLHQGRNQRQGSRCKILPSDFFKEVCGFLGGSGGNP
jgi:hypothetical protein